MTGTFSTEIKTEEQIKKYFDDKILAQGEMPEDQMQEFRDDLEACVRQWCFPNGHEKPNDQNIQCVALTMILNGAALLCGMSLRMIEADDPDFSKLSEEELLKALETQMKNGQALHLHVQNVCANYIVKGFSYEMRRETARRQSAFIKDMLDGLLGERGGKTK